MGRNKARIFEDYVTLLLCYSDEKKMQQKGYCAHGKHRRDFHPIQPKFPPRLSHGVSEAQFHNANMTALCSVLASTFTVGLFKYTHINGCIYL